MSGSILLNDIAHGIFAEAGCQSGVLSSVPVLRKYDFGFEPKSTVVAVFPYFVERERDANLCRYAVVPDYHTVVGDYLRDAAQKLSERDPDFHFRAFVDSSPVAEVYAAACAGLGVIGRNGLLITPQWGSYVFIGCIVTDVQTDIAPVEPQQCLNCGACLRSCPVKALSSDGFDKNRCLSAVTQRKGELTAAETQLIRENGLVWGCDTCQSVCPMNKNARPTHIPEFLGGVKQKLLPADLAGDLSDRAFCWRGKNVLRRNLEIFKQLW